MAGRGRQKTNRRMDEAISVLRGGLGFPGPVIRSTINKLLKVYGGDDGWPFMQDNSYQLVIDTMLADQEEAQEKSKNGDGSGAAAVVEHGEPSWPRNSEACDLSLCIPVVAEGESVTAEVEPSSELPVGADAPVADNASTPPTDVNWRDISCNDPVCPMEMDDDPRPPRARPVSIGGNVLPPRPRRKPCYGWISESESEGEEEDALSSSRKRKSDWDVGPFGLQGF